MKALRGNDVRIGDRIRILNRDGQYTKWAGREWTIDHIERPGSKAAGYDAGIGGNLVSARGLPVSLYDWEFEVTKRRRK